MVEFLVDLAVYCFKLLRVELPDCSGILSEIRSGSRTMGPNSNAYVWLCRLTAGAMAVQTVGVVLFLIALANLILHLKLGWPPFSFEDNHLLYWVIGFAPGQTEQGLHYCLDGEIVVLTLIVAVTMLYSTLAWLSKVLVRECCPLLGDTSRMAAA